MTTDETTRVVGFIEPTQEGDIDVAYLGDVDFAVVMDSLERLDAVRFVLHWPKRHMLRVTMTRPFEIVRNKLDEIFENILDVTPRYYKLVD